MASESVLARVREWLERENGKGYPGDTPWIVEEDKEEPGALVAHNVLFIAPIRIKCDPEHHVLRLKVRTGIRAYLLGEREKTRVYHRVLLLSRDPLIKGFIEGDEHEIVLSADLTTIALDEREFREALVLLMLATITLYKELERVSGAASKAKYKTLAEALARLPSLIRAMHSRGLSKERLVMIAEKVFGDREEAEKLVSMALGSGEKKRDDKEKGEGEGEIIYL